LKYFYIAGTVFFTVLGQLLLKWRIIKYGQLPESFVNKIFFLTKLLADPFILSGFLSAFIASFFWMAAMTKFDLSYAYPFMSSAFLLVFILSCVFFHEPFTLNKVIGLVFIIAGIINTSRSL